MNRDDYLAPKQPEFSLPSGFFVNPGSGKIGNNSNSNPTNQNQTVSTSNPQTNFGNQNFQTTSQDPTPKTTPPVPNFAPNYTQNQSPSSKTSYPNPNFANPQNLPQNQSFQANPKPFFGNQNPPKPPQQYRTTPPQPQQFQNNQPKTQPSPNQNPATQKFFPSNPSLNYQQPNLLQPHTSPNLLTNQPKPALNNRPAQTLQSQPQKPVINQKTDLELTLEKEEYETSEREKYHIQTLVISIVGLFFYFLGAFLMIFVNNVGGEAIVNLTSYTFSWELFFTEPGKFIQNVFLTVFGYFFQYARLFGFFPELGNLTTEPVSRYLLPVDIAIKLATIFYFHLRWMPWDTARVYRLGAFNSRYPYLTKSEKAKQGKPQVEDFKIASINIPAVELEKVATSEPTKTENPKPTISNSTNFDSKNHDDEDEDDDGILPFAGVQKPLEEWYHQNELKIYTFIRKNILPGSNLVLALYFSTLRVLDFREPQFIVLYVLVIMSMFWCMQTFLLILDHTQFQPEEDVESDN